MTDLDELNAKHRDALLALRSDVNAYVETLTIRDTTCIVHGTLQRLAHLLVDKDIPDDQMRSIMQLYVGILAPVIGQAHNDSACDVETIRGWDQLVSRNLDAINAIRLLLQAANS